MSAGDFLLELLQSLSSTKKLFDLFNFMISLMKYNAVYLKEEAVSGIIRCVQNLITLRGGHKPEKLEYWGNFWNLENVGNYQYNLR